MASVTTQKMGSSPALKGKPELPYLVSRAGKPVSVFRLHTKEFTFSIGRAGFCRLQLSSSCLPVSSSRLLPFWGEMEIPLESPDAGWQRPGRGGKFPRAQSALAT